MLKEQELSEVTVLAFFYGCELCYNESVDTFPVLVIVVSTTQRQKNTTEVILRSKSWKVKPEPESLFQAFTNAKIIPKPPKLLPRTRHFCHAAATEATEPPGYSYARRVD